MDVAFEEHSRKVFSLKDAMIVPNNPDRCIPTYCVIANSERKTVYDQIPKDLSKDEIVRCFRGMVTLHEMDMILQETHRHGIITFYMSNLGEGAIHYGTASAIEFEDVIYAQYREAGVLMYRGFSVQNCVDQCIGNRRDLGKGRQIPVHYGSKKLNFQTISSPLGTQIPQAAGAAYALKQRGTKNCVVCYYGDGAASEGDFHAGMNFCSNPSISCDIHMS